MTVSPRAARPLLVSVFAILAACSNSRQVGQGVPSSTNSSLAAAPLSIAADGNSVIALSIVARDEVGHAISGAPIVLSATGSGNVFSATGLTSGATLTGVADANGQFAASLSSTAAGAKTISAQIGTTDAVTLTTSVTFTPAADGAQLTLAASPVSVVADGSSTSTVTVSFRSASGGAISGQSVSLSATGSGNTFSPAGATAAVASGTTDANGEFVATLASTKAETKVVQAQIGAASASAAVTFIAGPPDVASSALIASPSTLATGSTAQLFVLLADANGNPVSDQSVALSVDGTASTFSASGQSGSTASGSTNAGGLFVATLSSDAAQTENVILSLDGGASFLTTPITFTAGGSGPTSRKLSLAATPNTLAADGAALAQLALALTDDSGTAISGATIQLSTTGVDTLIADGNGDAVSSVQSDASGKATAFLSSTFAQTVIVTATAANAGSVSVVVTFHAGDADAAFSSLIVNSSAAPPLLADGVQSYTFVVTAIDAHHNPLANQLVALSPQTIVNRGTGVGDVFAPAAIGSVVLGETDANGTFTASMTTTVAGARTVRASVGNLQLSMQVSFIAGSPNAAASSLSFEPPKIQADQTSVVTATIADQYGNPVTGQSLTLAGTGAGNLFSSGAQLGATFTGTTDDKGILQADLTVSAAETELITATFAGSDSLFIQASFEIDGAKMSGTVALFGGWDPAGTVVSLTADGGVSPQAIADDLGNYIVASIASGTYTVAFQDTLTMPADAGWVSVDGGAATLAFAGTEASPGIDVSAGPYVASPITLYPGQQLAAIVGSSAQDEAGASWNGNANGRGDRLQSSYNPDAGTGWISLLDNVTQIAIANPTCPRCPPREVNVGDLLVAPGAGGAPTQVATGVYANALQFDSMFTTLFLGENYDANAGTVDLAVASAPGWSPVILASGVAAEQIYVQSDTQILFFTSFNSGTQIGTLGVASKTQSGWSVSTLNAAASTNSLQGLSNGDVLYFTNTDSSTVSGTLNMAEPANAGWSSGVVDTDVLYDGGLQELVPGIVSYFTAYDSGSSQGTLHLVSTSASPWVPITVSTEAYPYALLQYLNGQLFFFTDVNGNGEWNGTFNVASYSNSAWSVSPIATSVLVYECSFAPSGKELLFVGYNPQNGIMTLSSATVDGQSAWSVSALPPVDASMNNFSFGGWLPDSQWFYYQYTGPTTSNDWAAVFESADGGSVSPAGSLPQFSANYSTALVTANASGSTESFSITSEAANWALTPVASAYRGSELLSPDGSLVVFIDNADVNGNGTLEVATAASSWTPVAIDTNVSANYGLQLSPDNRSVLYMTGYIAGATVNDDSIGTLTMAGTNGATTPIPLLDNSSFGGWLGSNQVVAQGVDNPAPNSNQDGIYNIAVPSPAGP